MDGYQLLGVTLGVFATLLIIALGIAAVGGIFWMLAIKFVAWLIGASVSWLTAYGIGFALVLIGALLRGGR